MYLPDGNQLNEGIYFLTTLAIQKPGFTYRLLMLLCMKVEKCYSSLLPLSYLAGASISTLPTLCSLCPLLPLYAFCMPTLPTLCSLCAHPHNSRLFMATLSTLGSLYVHSAHSRLLIGFLPCTRSIWKDKLQN